MKRILLTTLVLILAAPQFLQTIKEVRQQR